MLRTSAPRSAVRALNSITTASTRSSINASLRPTQFTSRLCTISKARPNAAVKPLTMAMARHQSGPPYDKVDKKAEESLAEKALKATPETVSVDSSTHPVFGEVGLKEEKDKDADMMAGVKADLATIRETFSLQDVPRQAYVVGMAGVLPYLATSLSTVFCAYEINHAHAHGSGVLLSDQTAELLLHVIEPLQVGYGAVIISFLGAIHWGLEWAGFGGHQGYPRYAIGIVAPAVAWPTILMPVEQALITQFLAFVFLYYTDSRAAQRGWAPSWYSVYRFVLTFIVGASIVISLVGRGQIADRVGKLPGPADRIKALRDSQTMQAEKEEAEKRAKQIAADEAEDEE
ncbi:hypothetical protein AAFC00_004941 [Neodothiora populina]|uniref:Mitochondrial inner membrane protein 1 n=1 Tax=Neodothiora populina TaxID=2781224 RepID=A0ABR3P3Q7_9PEZI